MYICYYVFFLEASINCSLYFNCLAIILHSLQPSRLSIKLRGCLKKDP